MKRLDILVFILNIIVIVLLSYIYYDMTANPVNKYSDGQAIMGVGFYVVIVQLLRLYLLVGLIVYGARIVVTRNFKTRLTIANVLFFAAGLILGYVIIN